MSLVDSGYGSDEDEDLQDANYDVRLVELESTSRGGVPDTPNAVPSSSTSVATARQSEQEIGGRSLSNPSNSSAQLLLPDVSELFGPSTSDGAATSSPESQRKRPAVNGNSHSMPHTKLPRGTLMPSRIRPDTAGGCLLLHKLEEGVTWQRRISRKSSVADQNDSSRAHCVWIEGRLFPAWVTS